MTRTRAPRLELSSLARLSIGQRVVPIVPFWSVVYLTVAAAIVAAAVVVLEKRVLPRMELKRMVPSPRWQQETDKITAYNLAKIHVETDNVWKSDGFPVSPQKTRSRRILVIGDSFAWGAALANMNDVWWRQLQRELERRGYANVEVIAACAPGASTIKELEFARQAVTKYAPDLLIWGYVTNDPDAGLVKHITDDLVLQKFGPDWKFQKATSIVADMLPLITYRLDSLRKEKRQALAADDAMGYDYEHWERKLVQPPTIDRFEQTLRDVRGFQDAVHIPGFFVTLPNFPSTEYFAQRYEPLKPLFKRTGLPFYDILPEFVRSRGGLPLLAYAATPNDGHPAPISTSFFALATANILERDYREFLGPRSAPARPPLHVNDWAPPAMAVDRSGEAAHTVTIDYPKSDDGLLRMPSDRPFVQLNFDSPVSIAEVRASGPYMTHCAIGYSAEREDAHYDDQTVHDLPEKRGKDLSWRLDGHAGTRAVTTLRVSAGFLPREKISTPKRLPLPRPYYREVANAWFVNLPELEDQSDDIAHAERSTLLVLEDGKPIGAPHSALVDIRAKGGGLFSHWKGVLDFSTSDNSDPNTNGHSYMIDLTQPPPDARRIRLTIITR
jgi:hypothetical protein